MEGEGERMCLRSTTGGGGPVPPLRREPSGGAARPCLQAAFAFEGDLELL